MHAQPLTNAPDLDSQILKAAGTLGILGGGADSTPRMLSLLCDPKVEGSAIAELIERQPPMYARVLRVANSSYYGQSRSITTMERALVLLGRDAVRGIAAATCFDRAMARATKGQPLLDMLAVTRHSLATAAAAEALARIARPHLAAEAFIAGLLHNLGIAIQAQMDPSGVEAMIDANRRGVVAGIRTLESHHALAGHERCLATVFEAWQMPQTLVAVAQHHHAPLEAPETQRDLTALVSLGAGVGLAMGYRYALEPVSVEPQLPTVRRLGLTDEQVDGAAARLQERVAELGAALLDG